MLLYMSNAVFHLAGDGKVCVLTILCSCIYPVMHIHVHVHVHVYIGVMHGYPTLRLQDDLTVV